MNGIGNNKHDSVLIVGIIVGMHTARLRQREEEAIARERETALLNRFSAHLVSELSVNEMAGVLVSEVAQTTNAKDSDLWDGCELDSASGGDREQTLKRVQGDAGSTPDSRAASCFGLGASASSAP